MSYCYSGNFETFLKDTTIIDYKEYLFDFISPEVKIFTKLIVSRSPSSHIYLFIHNKYGEYEGKIYYDENSLLSYTYENLINKINTKFNETNQIPLSYRKYIIDLNGIKLIFNNTDHENGDSYCYIMHILENLNEKEKDRYYKHYKFIMDLNDNK